MEFTEEHKVQQSRQTEMVRVCMVLFRIIDRHGITPEVRTKFEKYLAYWNSKYSVEISCDQLVDFIVQVVEGVFGKSEISVIRQRLSIDTEQMSKGEDDETIRNSQ